MQIKADMLRKGVNVLAVEFHRSPYFGSALEREDEGPSLWTTCGLVSLELRADGSVTPNVARPKGPQVWVESVMYRSTPTDWADPVEKLGPLSLVGCRQGVFTGKVVVGSESGLEGVKADIKELKSKDGKATIPASRIKVLYVVRDDQQYIPFWCIPTPPDGYWDTLRRVPPDKVDEVKFKSGKGAAAIQPVIVEIHVPADAAPGDYSGTLTVSAAGAKTLEVPVQLRVIDWKLPEPKDYVTHMGIIESPESVAMKYNVPLWSEEHWKLMETSFRLMGELGGKQVVLPLICRTNFGNAESLVRWMKDGDGYKFDFTNFDRYLDLAQKYQNMDVVCLYIWEPYTGRVTWTNKPPDSHPPRVTGWDPQTNHAEEIQVANFETPEGKKVWGRWSKRPSRTSRSAGWARR